MPLGTKISVSGGDRDEKRLTPVSLGFHVLEAICSDCEVANKVARHTR